MANRTPNIFKSTLEWMIFILMVLIGCSSNETPKPRGYIRIDLPEKAYQMYDSVLPCRFEYPVYARVVMDPMAEEDNLSFEKYNIEFPEQKGTLHLTYAHLKKGNLDTLIGEAVEFVYKHVPKATTITKTLISNEENRVFGTLFTIRGKHAASTCQFYVTDSISNFLRGALYLNTNPDNDSLKPVIDFLKEDVNRFINTLQWE
jgi:gliding motility-associated lipoprotein GldD